MARISTMKRAIARISIDDDIKWCNDCTAVELEALPPATISKARVVVGTVVSGSRHGTFDPIV